MRQPQPRTRHTSSGLTLARWDCKCLPRSPCIRLRLAYTARCSAVCFALPSAWSAFRLGDINSQAQISQLHHDRADVIPLVRHHFRNAFRIDFVPA
jgi:hypothetical protein